MSYWKPLAIGGKIIDLAHLEPFEFSVIPKGREIPATIFVVFNNHCFSMKFDPRLHSLPLPLTHAPKHEQRGFDETRYELSKLLPALVRAFDGRRIAQTREGSLVRVTLADGRDYAIFFSLKKAGPSTCSLLVMSAYLLDRPRERIIATGEMKFNVAIALVLAGKKPKFPPGRF